MEAVMKIADLFNRKIKGAPDGRYNLYLQQNEFSDEALKVTRVEYTYDGKRLQLKAYYPERVVDCDRWTLRVFNATIENPVTNFMENGYWSGSGYMSSIAYFDDDEPIDIEPNDDDDDPDIKGYVDSCFPPEKLGDAFSNIAIKVVFTITPRNK
jgi:hypothetical protein